MINLSVFLTFLSILVLLIPIEFLRLKQLPKAMNLRFIPGIDRVYQNFEELISHAGFDKCTISNIKQKSNKHLITTADELIFHIMMHAIIGGMIGFFIYHVAYAENSIIFGIIIGLLCASIPYLRLKTAVQIRKKLIEKELPSILTTLAVITDAGLNLYQAMHEVARFYEGEMSKELMFAVKQIEMGKPVWEALEQMQSKNNVEELTTVTTVLGQALKKGSSGVTVILREQAGTLWANRKNLIKEKGEKASAMLFLPVYLLIFPAVALLILTPSIINVIRAFQGV